jgi:hypothetical protein
VNPAELFRKETDTLQLAPGDFVFREGEKGGKMYVLLEGKSKFSLVILCSRLRAQARSLVRWR